MQGNNQKNYRNIQQSQILSTNHSRNNMLRNDCDMSCNVSDSFEMGAALAMAYVPFQNWENIYDPHMALKAGTLFKDLEKRFYGIRGCHH